MYSTASILASIAVTSMTSAEYLDKIPFKTVCSSWLLRETLSTGVPSWAKLCMIDHRELCKDYTRIDHKSLNFTCWLPPTSTGIEFGAGRCSFGRMGVLSSASPSSFLKQLSRQPIAKMSNQISSFAAFGLLHICRYPQVCEANAGGKCTMYRLARYFMTCSLEPVNLWISSHCRCCKAYFWFIEKTLNRDDAIFI